MNNFIRIGTKVLLESYKQGDVHPRFLGFEDPCCADCGNSLDDPGHPAQYAEEGSIIVCLACGCRYYVQNLGASCS